MARRHSTKPLAMRISVDLLDILRAKATTNSLNMSETVEGILRAALGLPYPTPTNPFAVEPKK